MSIDRKQKVKKSDAERSARRITPIESKPATVDIKNPLQNKPADFAVNDRLENGRVLEPAYVVADSNMPSFKAGAEVMNPIKPKNALDNANERKTNLPQFGVKAEAMNPVGIKTPDYSSKPVTISDMLADMRSAAMKDKTDAAKMQKYYALSDVLQALGKMGGAAAGGAIGGDLLGGAPNVGDYKESRGYLDAIEKSKQANEKLRAIDERAFNLAYNKQQRDEERAYQAAEKKAEREYRQKENEMERQWQIKLYDYKTQIEQAIADKDWARSAQLKLQMAKDEQKHSLELQRLRNAGALDEKKLGLETSKWQANTYNMVPIAFDDGTGVEIAEKDYEGLKRRYIGRKVGDRTITKDNIDLILGQNPQLVKDYFNSIGRKVSFVNDVEEANPVVATPNKAEEVKFYYNPITDTNMKAVIPTSEGTEDSSVASVDSSQNKEDGPQKKKEEVSNEGEEDINEYIQQFL